jgi:serine/threonine protein kinase
MSDIRTLDYAFPVTARMIDSSMIKRELERSESNSSMLSWDDVEVGTLLGSGSFASVYSIKEITSPRLLKMGSESKLTTDDAESDTESATVAMQQQDDEDDDYYYFRDKGCLALKCLTKGSPHKQFAASCLAKEAAILQKLPSHSNIIKLIGFSSNLGDDPTEGFLLLQRVRETLVDLSLQWKLQRSFSKSEKRPLFFCITKRKIQEALHLEQSDRVQTIALGLARAMAFLHHHGVLYRDLKPGNVGIDYQGQVRLFDFGFARTYQQEQSRLMTRMVGTPRYMSPEVACAEGKYGFPSDVHSFAMVLWEILALRKPFEEVKSMKGLLKAIYVEQKRPPLKPVICPNIRSLLMASWHPNPHQRPPFSLIVNVLEDKSAKTNMTELHRVANSCRSEF